MSQTEVTPTKKGSIKVLSDIKLTKDTIIINDTSRNEFPANPELGTECLVNGMKYVYTSINNDEPIWFPFGAKRSHSTVIQPNFVKTWVIDHNLSTMDIIVSVYDESNRVIDAPYTILSADTIEIELTVPTSGKAVIFGASEKYAGYTPSSGDLTVETVSVGFTEPDEASPKTTIYIQLES